MIFEASRAVDGDCIDPAFFPARTDAPGGIDCLMTLLLCFNLLEESESLSLEDKKVNISYYDKLFLALSYYIHYNDILYIPGSNTRRIRWQIVPFLILLAWWITVVEIWRVFGLGRRATVINCTLNGEKELLWHRMGYRLN